MMMYWPLGSLGTEYLPLRPLRHVLLGRDFVTFCPSKDLKYAMTILNALEKWPDSSRSDSRMTSLEGMV